MDLSDNLIAAHLIYVHPSVTHLKIQFQLIIRHGFVPNSITYGLSIPR